MRSAVLVLGGVVLWAMCLGATQVAVGLNARSASRTTATFATLWFFAAAFNLWMGVTHAGYALREELPIFLIIFVLPVAVAIVVRWKFWSVVN